MAPTVGLQELLRPRTRKPSFRVERGVDRFLVGGSRERPDKTATGLGYVGRLSPERNLRTFKTLEDALIAKGIDDFRLEIVGHGSEADWLRENSRSAHLPGVLLGDALAQAYETAVAD